MQYILNKSSDMIVIDHPNKVQKDRCIDACTRVAKTHTCDETLLNLVMQIFLYESRYREGVSLL